MLPRARTVAPALLLGLTALTVLVLPSTTAAEAAPPSVAATVSAGSGVANGSSGLANGSSGAAAGPALSADGLVLRNPLSWSPPAMAAPVTVAVGSSSATLVLNNARDYVLRLPAEIGRAHV